MAHSDAAVRTLAEAICRVTFGDWGATGVVIQLALDGAAEAALSSLDADGWDLTMLDARHPVEAG